MHVFVYHQDAHEHWSLSLLTSHQLYLSQMTDAEFAETYPEAIYFYAELSTDI